MIGMGEGTVRFGHGPHCPRVFRYTGQRGGGWGERWLSLILLGARRGWSPKTWDSGRQTGLSRKGEFDGIVMVRFLEARKDILLAFFKAYFIILGRFIYLSLSSVREMMALRSWFWSCLRVVLLYWYNLLRYFLVWVFL